MLSSDSDLLLCNLPQGVINVDEILKQDERLVTKMLRSKECAVAAKEITLEPELILNKNILML